MNFKGGVGKTTIAQNLAVAFKQMNYRVGLIDADVTKASTHWADKRDGKGIEPTIPCQLLTNPKSFVKQVTAQYESYDILIIDCPPALSDIALKAMLISELLIIPVSATGGSDIYVTGELLAEFQKLRDVKEVTGATETQAHLLINMVRANVGLHAVVGEMAIELAEENKIGIFQTQLNTRTAYGEANAMGKGVLELKDRKAAREIEQLAKEILALFAVAAE